MDKMDNKFLSAGVSNFLRNHKCHFAVEINCKRHTLFNCLPSKLGYHIYFLIELAQESSVQIALKTFIIS